MNNLETQIDNLRTLQQSYDQIAGAAEAYNTGKVQLAANITAKGVPASATETIPELAAKVEEIVQTQQVINGGEMYAKQLFGSLTTPNYWNLYEVLAQLLSDGRLVSYGGILLAEYYKGYDSLALAGAGTGGAYVVSDKDENGQFKMYTEDTTHTWATEFDDKGNRWVAYCFADEYHDFQITDTNTSPRSIFIGRNVGTITSLVNSRVSDIVVPDGNELRLYDCNNFSQNFGRVVSIKMSETVSNRSAILVSSSTEIGYIKIDVLKQSSWVITAPYANNLTTLIVDVKKSEETQVSSAGVCSGRINMLKTLIINGLESGVISLMGISGNGDNLEALSSVYITNIEQGTIGFEYNSIKQGNLHYVYISDKNNQKTKSVVLLARANTSIPSVTDVELINGWCKRLDISKCINITEANMYAHILQRLKQDEPDCGDGVTITLGATNLTKLTSEESQALLAELQGTYGYTFQ